MRALCAMLLASSTWGCGGLYYVVNVNSASSRLEEAKALGAEQYAPYEYYYAQAHLEQAQVEASRANYSDAVNYADAADEAAKQAGEIARQARKGRP